MLRVGCAVEAKYKRSSRYYPGVVVAVCAVVAKGGGATHSTSAAATAFTYAIKFEDGDMDEAVPRAHVRGRLGLSEAEERRRARAYQLRLRLHWPPAFFVESGGNVRGDDVEYDVVHEPRQGRARVYECKPPKVVVNLERFGVKRLRALEKVNVFIASRHWDTESVSASGAHEA